MKDWAAARQRVQDMKKTDPKASEKLNKEITSVGFLNLFICHPDVFKKYVILIWNLM